MGQFFTSFDEAWQYFLARTEPLEWFFGDFSEDETVVAEGWVIIPPDEIKRAALSLQRELSAVEWLALVPEHFLHVWLGGATATGERPRELSRRGAFDALYRRVNCFHSAVIVEVEARPAVGLGDASAPADELAGHPQVGEQPLILELQ